jgi:hypothetical protein
VGAAFVNGACGAVVTEMDRAVTVGQLRMTEAGFMNPHLRHSHRLYRHVADRRRIASRATVK